jgi:hypothetical protein
MAVVRATATETATAMEKGTVTRGIMTLMPKTLNQQQQQGQHTWDVPNGNSYGSSNGSNNGGSGGDEDDGGNSDGGGQR